MMTELKKNDSCLNGLIQANVYQNTAKKSTG